MPPRKKKTGKAAKRTRSASAKTSAADRARPYTHDAEQVSRPEIGTQERFRDKKPPRTYRYDSSLAPELQWDGGNAKVRERAEELLRIVENAVSKAAEGDEEAAKIAQDAARELRKLQEPFLNWAGKAERGEFEVPTLPLFVHERLSTQAILESVTGWKRDEQVDLFGDPHRPLAEQLRAYEHKDKWVNRMILGDSLVVMNSLLHYEGMGGQVQMIYLDPPYGVKFESNFQPFVRHRRVTHNDDADLTREPEMVQAYRDTWVLGIHTYLSYLRDRLIIARSLLSETGSIFVQISDENVDRVTALLTELFGEDNFAGHIVFRTTGGQSSALLSGSVDHLLWYAKNRSRARESFWQPVGVKKPGEAGATQYTMVEPLDFSLPPRALTAEELSGAIDVPEGWRILAHDTLYSQGDPSNAEEKRFLWKGEWYVTPPNTHWKPGVKSGGMERLAAANRLMRVGNTLRYKRYLDDYPVFKLDNIWDDTAKSGFAPKKQYVVETAPRVVERCVLMTTKPGDVVLDPTCGSGTTAYVAERWGRRWITIDTSRVPLALARQRLLTATFPWHQLKDNRRGPAGGFIYERRQNARGEEIGGLVPHITLKSIANDESPAIEVLVDRPEQDGGITRVTGPFVVEATIPTPVDWEGDGVSDSGIPAAEEYAAFADRMLEVLRRSPSIQLGGNRSVKFEQVRQPAKAMVLNAEAVVAGTKDRAAFVFGPENGAISEALVHQALKEADRRNYGHLYAVGFAIEPNARQLIEATRGGSEVEAWYVQATPDLIMGSLLKTTRASQLFSVCGLPDIELRPAKPKAKGEPEKWIVHLRAVDTFDPTTMLSRATKGSDVPAWFLDTDYNNRVFRVCQAFFPKTGAWDALKRALKADFDESLFEHLSGDTSAEFEAGEHRMVGVKVIDERGNELMVTQALA